MASHLLGDLNDFIQPSQVCVKPVPSKEETIKASEVRLDVEERDSLSTNSVTISLNDCLACSGCITSAETVLVSQQTYRQVYQVLDVNTEAVKTGLPKPQLVVMSVSPQSLTALAARFNLSVEAVTRRLYAFLKETLAVDFVFDTVLARDISLFACAAEFIERYEAKDKSPLPVITGACPGWICYVEKTQESLVPLLSRVKSPQQIMGTLVKHFFPSRCLASPSLSPSHVFHVVVMPCYDKKLEASRPDFFDEPSQSKEVDCVITTGELMSMIEERIGLEQFLALQNDPKESRLFDPQLSLLNADGSSLLSHAGSGSGGYMEHVLAVAAKRIYGLDLVRDCDGNLLIADAESSPFALVVQTHRNADYRDFILQRKRDSFPLFRFAQVYGFRNVQTLVRKLRTGRVTYDYIEVMACPGGCLNGGGQKLPNTYNDSDGNDNVPRTPTQNLIEMNRLYRQMPAVQPLTVAKVERIVREWLGGATSPLLRTVFRAVPKASESAQSNISVQW